jgi:hypothetical protein
MRLLSFFLFLGLFIAGPALYAQKSPLAEPTVSELFKSILDESNDTLGYPMNSTPSVYTFSTDQGEFRGYMCGNNAFLDKAKVQFFNAHPHYAGITGVRMKFAHAVGDGYFKIGIWKTSPQSSMPTSMIYEQQVFIPDIIQHISDSNYTDINFDSLVSNPGPFFIGFIIPTGPGDTAVLYSSKAGESSTSNGWEMRATGSWYNFAIAYGHQFNVELYVFPIMTGVMGNEIVKTDDLNPMVEIWPNPVCDILNYRMNPAYSGKEFQWSVTDLNCKSLLSGLSMNQSLNENGEVNLTSLPAGVYSFNIQTHAGVFTKKVVKTP